MTQLTIDDLQRWDVLCAEQEALLKQMAEALDKAERFTAELTLVGGKYPEINGTQLVADAYKEHRHIDKALTAYNKWKEGR